MDIRIIDLVSTKYLTEKMANEIDLEKLVNNSNDINAQELSHLIMKKVEQLRVVSANMQAWEDIVNQITKKPEKGDNK